MSCKKPDHASNKRDTKRIELRRPKVPNMSMAWMRGADRRCKDAVSKKNDDYIGTS